MLLCCPFERRSFQAVAIHECTAYFDQSVFQKYLDESFEVHRFEEPESWQELSRSAKAGGPGVWLLSPTLFGWPCSRPRPLLLLKMPNSYFVFKCKIGS